MYYRLGVLVALLIGSVALAKPREYHLKVDGVTRDALVYAPASADKSEAPVVFAFHGHGGSMKKAAELFDFQTHWPQAIVVYMQGLPIKSITDAAGKKAGWQHDAGTVNDRDLKFFDATLEQLKKDYKVDTRRIYATGHSNGGGFTYLLWAERGDKLAAVAPSSATSA